MTDVIHGVVRDGLIVPNVPLPEGAQVEICLAGAPEVPPELEAELKAWQLAGAQSLELVERLVTEGEAHEAR